MKPEKKERVYKRWGVVCYLQGRRCTGNGRETVDHWIPVSRGGSDVVFNLRPSCRKCNNDKGNMTPAQWAEVTGREFPTEVKLALPKPSGKYEFATMADLQASLKRLRGDG
jgi:5-methylcytosine-specific restriction endonuclease McrA